MSDRFNFPTLSKIGNVDTPVNTTDAANKSYVDTRASFYFDSAFADIDIASGTVQNNGDLTGTLTTFDLISNDETALAAYLSDPTRASAVYRFTGSTIGFQVKSATAGAGLVTVTINSTNFTPTVTSNSFLQIQSRTAISDLAITSPLTSTISTTALGDNLLTLGSSGGGGGTLQSLTDVMVVEPTFSRVGTFTVDTVDATNDQIIITQTGTGIVVGDYINGTGIAGSSTLKVIFVTTIGSNTNIQFASSPAPYFAIGNPIYRLGTGIDGYNLQWSNTANRWIAVSPSFTLPFDITSWRNRDNKIYITDVSVPIQTAVITSNVATLTSPWTYGVATLPGFTSGKEVIGQDISGKSVSGLYLDATASGGAFATLNDVLPDRLAGTGFALNTSYTLYWRQGIDALQNTVQFSGNTITQGQGAIDAEIGTVTDVKYGTVALDNANQVSTSATTVLISGGGVTVTRANSVALFNTITGQSATTPPVGPTAPLAKYSYIAVSTDGTTFSTPVQFNTVQVPGVGGAQIQFNFTTVPAAITTATQSNWLYYGDGQEGTVIFTPTTPVLNQELGLIAANTVNSLDGIAGAVSLVAGTGIGISDSVGAKQITITNTGSGTPGAGNTVDFTNDQFAETGITEAATESVYIQMGYTTSLEVGSGGTLNGTTYWTTPNTAPSGSGNGIQAKVATTWSSLGTVFYTPAYQVVFTTPAGASANNYILDNLLFAKKNYTGNIYANANLWPPFRDSGGASDDVQVIPVSRPTFSVASSGTNTWTATIGQGIWRASFGNYAWAAGDLTTEYVAYLRIAENSGATQPPTFVSATRTSGLGGIQILSSLPGTSGSTPTLQQVVNVGNQLSNASPNIATISFLDTTVTPNQTRLISAAGGLEFNKLQLDGSTSGNVAITASATTTTYPIVLPASQGNSGQALLNDGSGNTSWGWSASLIKAVSLLNVATLSGTAVTVDSVSLTAGDTVGLFGQTNAAQNGLYIVAAGAWSKIPDWEYQQVQALSGTANIGQSFIKTNATGNETWVLQNVNAINLIQSGYGVFNVSGFTITARKYDGSNASAGDWFIGQSVWGDGLVTNVAYGGIVIASIGTPSGTDINLTLNQVSATWSLGRGLRVLPRLSDFDYPIVSKGGNLIGLDLGNGLSIDSVGRLQASGASVWLTGSGTPADSLGVVGNYYQDTSITPNYVWLKTQTTTSPYWVRQPNLENAIRSYTVGTLLFSFARVIATSNITLSGTQTIDGVAVVVGNIVLAASQTDSTTNGLYTVAAGAWTRVVSPAIQQGLVVIISAGTTQQGNSWVQTSPIVTVGTSTQTWSVFAANGASTFLATMLASTTLASRSIPANNSTIQWNSDGTYPVNQAISGGNYSLRQNNQGFSISGSNNVLQIGYGTNFSQVDSQAQWQMSNITLLGTTNNGTGFINSNTSNTIEINPSASSAGTIYLGTTFSSPARIGLTLTNVATGNPTLAVAGPSASSFNLQHAAGAQVNIGSGTGAFVAIAGASSGACVIQPTGSNVGLTVAPNGTSALILGNTATQTGWTTPSSSTTQSILTATGSGSNIDAVIQSKGTGAVLLGQTTSATGFTVQGGQTTYAALNATGSNANIDLVLTPKGSGSLYPLGGTISATLSNQPRIFLATQLGSTTLGPGAGLQAIRSNSNGAAPFWSAVGGTWFGRLAAGTSIPSSDTTINATVVSNNLPSYVSFANGALTNNSSFTITVSVSYSLALTNSSTPAPPETDMWVAAGGVRYAQIAFGANDWLGSAGAWSALRSLNVDVPLAANTSVSCLAYCNGAVASQTGAIFGGFTTTTIFTVL